MLGNVPRAGHGFHHVSSVKLAAISRGISISLACELLSPPINRMINVVPLCRK